MKTDPTYFKFLLRILSLLIPVLLFIACAAQKDPRINSVEHFKRGNHYFTQKLYLKAVDEYDAALQLDQSQAIFFYNRGLTFYELRLYEKAVKDYTKALEMEPNMADAWHNLALAYDKLNESERAFMAYEKYQQLQGGSVQP